MRSRGLRVVGILAASTAYASAAFAQGAPVALSCGTSVDSTLISQGFDFYNIPAQAGDSILLRVLATSGATFTPKVAVVDARNQPVAARHTPFTLTPNQIDPLVTGATFAGVFDLTAGGNYRVQVQNAGTDQGTYRIVFVWLNKPCSLTLNCGAAALDPIVTRLQTRSYSFAGNAGDLLGVRFARIGSSDKSFDATVFVFGPDGQLMRIFSNSSTTTPPLAAADTLTNNPVTLTVKLAIDGPVNLVVFDPANLTGTYAISVSRLNGPCGNNALSCSVPTISHLVNPLSTESYSLNLSAGDPVILHTAAVDLNSSLIPLLAIFDPQGNTVNYGAPVASGPHAVVRYSFTAQVSGSYTLLVEDGSRAIVNTGSYAISIVRPNQPCKNSQGLTCDPVDGSVSGILGGSYYTVNAKANAAFIVRVLRGSPNGSFQPQVDIYDPTGAALPSLSTTDLGRTSFTAAVDGLYTLVVSDGFDGAQSGAYTLSALPVNGACATATLSCGAPSPGSFTRPLGASVYSYAAAPAESFTVRMLDSTGALQPALEVYDARGNSVGQIVPGSLTGVDVPQTTGGTYTVIATDASKRPTGGPFAIDLLRTVNTCGTAPVQAQTTTGVISAVKPYTAYTISASSGDILSVRGASFTPGFSAQMDLYDPVGTRLDSATFGLSRKAALAGNYTVVMGAAAPRSGGAYSFSWQVLNRPAGTSALSCGASTEASLTSSSEFRYYQITASAGDVMRLLFTRLSDNFAPQVELFDATGARLSQTSDVTQKAGAAGNYLVFVSPSTSNGETGSYALTYQRPNNPCSPANLTCGQTTLRQVRTAGQLDAFTFAGTGGDVADLKLSPRSGSYSPLLELYDGAGNLLTSGSGALVRFKLPASGTYGALVRDRVGVNTGSYRVGLQDETNACTVSDTEAPAIALLQPTGGEVIMGGSPYNIQWLSDDNVAVATHDVALSMDSGQTFPTAIASGLSGNVQAFNWTVPTDIAPGRKAVVRVTATDSAGNATPAASGLLSVIGSGFTPNSSATYAYDAVNRLVQGALGDGRTVQYMWDVVGNLVSIAVSGQ